MYRWFHPRFLCHQGLCYLLAALMFATPGRLFSQQPAAAAAPPAPLDSSYVLPDACVVVAARPAQVLASPIAFMLPTEVIQAAGVQEAGIDPLALEQVVISAAPPTQGPPGYAVHAKFNKPVAPKFEMLGMPLAEQQVGGRTVLKTASGNPMEPGLYLPDNQNIVLFDDFSAAKLPTEATATRGPLATQFLDAYDGDDLLLMLDLEPLRPFIQMGLAQAPIEPQFAQYVEIPNLVKTIRLRLNFSHTAPSELIVSANNPADAEKLVGMFNEAKQLMIAQAAMQTQMALASDDPIEQAAGRYSQRMSTYWDQAMQLNREGEQIILFHTDGAGAASANPLVYVAIIGVLVALLLPAVQAAREAARRNQSMNNLKQINLGLLNYESARGTYPAHANYGADGKPLLSWRVHILPFLEQQALYQQFHLDEPWDSEHNKTLIPMMPEIYIDPSSSIPPAAGQTHYLGASGPNRLFTGAAEGRRIASVTDGTSNTVAVVQVGDEQAVPWTAPGDWDADTTPTSAGSGLHTGVFLAAFADGSVQAIADGIDPTVFKALLTVDGDEVVNR
jgi:type II secretory pathway pseudopilin PulG